MMEMRTLDLAPFSSSPLIPAVMMHGPVGVFLGLLTISSTTSGSPVEREPMRMMMTHRECEIDDLVDVCSYITDVSYVPYCSVFGSLPWMRRLRER